jgi:hypothetical protein
MKAKAIKQKPLIAQALTIYEKYYRPENANGIFYESQKALGEYASLLRQTNQVTKAAHVQTRIKEIQVKQSKTAQ